jgi:hypothetical protein
MMKGKGNGADSFVRDICGSYETKDLKIKEYVLSYARR